MESCAYFCALGTPFERELPREVAVLRDVSKLTARRWRLCALNGEGARRLNGQLLRCDTLLLPEGVCPEAVRARQVVSYGLGVRNTLTLSGMDTRLLLSVQRQFENMRGGEVEVQELTLPENWRRWETPQILLLAGVRLLLGGL